MLKSACASFPTWLLNVRDLTHLMSFLSFWKFFPESLSCLLMCHLTEQEWGSWCTWTLALWARESAPVCQKCPLLSPSLHAGPARSCPHRDQLASECSRQEVGGAVQVRGDHDDWNGSRSLRSYFYNCPLLLFSTVLTLPTRTALYRPAHLLGRENWGMEVSRLLSWAQWAMELSSDRLSPAPGEIVCISAHHPPTSCVWQSPISPQPLQYWWLSVSWLLFPPI